MDAILKEWNRQQDLKYWYFSSPLSFPHLSGLVNCLIEILNFPRLFWKINYSSNSSHLRAWTHISHGLLQKLPSMDLLSLSHRHVSGLNLELLPQCSDGVSRVWSHWKEADKRCPWIWFLPHLLQVKNHPFSVLLPHCISYVFTSLRKRGGIKWCKLDVYLLVRNARNAKSCWTPTKSKRKGNTFSIKG